MMSRLKSQPASQTSWLRALRRFCASVLACLAITTTLATSAAAPAHAHTGLIGSSPADGSRMSSRPEDMRFTFDQTLQPLPGWDAVVITGPDGSPRPAREVRIDGNTVTASCEGLWQPGTYTISYRVISGDGHPIAGHIAVALDRAHADAPATTAFTAPTDGVPAWAWILELAIALFVLQAFLRSRSERSGAAAPARPAMRRLDSAARD